MPSFCESTEWQMEDLVLNRGGGRQDCPKQPMRKSGYRLAASPFVRRVPDLQSPPDPRKRADVVQAAFGTEPVQGCLFGRLATYQFPLGQAITALHPCCLAGEVKHMFNTGPSVFRVVGTRHSVLPQKDCELDIKPGITFQISNVSQGAIRNVFEPSPPP